MPPASISVSFVIPTYNERENIAELVPAIVSFFKRRKISAEILVVDDQSPDGTGEEVKKLSERYSNVKLLVPPEKKGIGNALAYGYDASKGKCIVSMDADLTFQEEVILQLLKKIDEGRGIVVASKYHPHSKLVRETFKEKIQTLVSRVGAIYMQVITRTPMLDFSMNFRALRKEVWKSINVRDPQNFFLAECLFQANQKGFRMTEVPFTFNKRKFGASKTRLWRQMNIFLKRTWEYRFWNKKNNMGRI